MSVSTTTCKACNATGFGMIGIYKHPNNVDSMYSFVCGIEQVRNGAVLPLRNMGTIWGMGIVHHVMTINSIFSHADSYQRCSLCSML